jgi:hypothetical protein
VKERSKEMRTIEGLETERYMLACHDCERTWTVTYQVLSFHDDAGDHRLYYRAGMPAMAPWSVPCPYCDGERVTLVPHP